MSVAHLVPTVSEADRAAEFCRRLNAALRDHVDPIIREIETAGFVAHFAPAAGENMPVQCIHMAKLFE
jgi:hypothetical protein